jgi:hypothetical protein
VLCAFPNASELLLKSRLQTALHVYGKELNDSLIPRLSIGFHLAFRYVSSTSVAADQMQWNVYWDIQMHCVQLG